LKPDTILALIEQDAVSGHWVVSDQIYAAANQLTGAEHSQRVARVKVLKRAVFDSPLPRAPITMAHVRETLGAVASASAPASGGSN